MAGIREYQRAYYGLAFFVGVAVLLAVQMFDKSSITQRALQRRRDSAERTAKAKAREEMLHKLTPDEKAYLAPYIIELKTMQRFDDADGIAGGLRARGVIFSGATQYNPITGPEFSLSPWARDYLTKKPQLLEGASRIKPRSRFKEF